MIIAFNIIGVVLISSSISAMTTMTILNKKKTPPKTPLLDSDMQIILDNNNYMSLEEWKVQNDISAN